MIHHSDLTTFLMTTFFLPISNEFRHVMIWPAITVRDHEASELLGNVIGFLPPPIPTHPNHPHPPIPSPSCISSLSRFMLRISARLSVWYMRPGWLLLSHLVTTAGSKYYDKEVSLTQNSPSTLRRTAYGVQLTDKLRMRAARTCQRNGSVCGIKFILFYLFYCGIIIDNC